MPLVALSDRLQLAGRELVSIVGGGGKTTTLFALGAQLGPRVAMTTTTKMGSDRDGGFDVALDPTDDELRTRIESDPKLLVWLNRNPHRAEGVAPDDCDRWFRRGLVDHVVVEADGSRRRPFKAPYPYEPVVPAATTTLIACIGASALGRPIDQCCHRPDAVVAIVGGEPDDPLTPAKAAVVLQSDLGSRKGLPPSARYLVLIQQVDPTDPASMAGAAALASALGDTEVHLVART